MKLLPVASVRKWTPTFLLGAVISLGLAHETRADITFYISNATGASVDFDGDGTGASFDFANNASGQGFQITESTGNGTSVGFFGSIGGTFSYLTSAITTYPVDSFGEVELAPVTTSDGSISITDSNGAVLTAQITGVEISMLIGGGGSVGGVNPGGSINIGDVTYSGSNAELLALKNNVNAIVPGGGPEGGVINVSFQYLPAQSLVALAANGKESSTSYSGTILASGIDNGQGVPEPGTLSLAFTGLTLIGAGAAWSRRRRAA